MDKATITDNIEDDIRALLTEKIDREEFLRRLGEEFVYIAVKPGHAGARVELMLIAVKDEDGMFLPVFTSEARLRATPFIQGHEALRVAFDEIMRQIRPDTGLILNPGHELGTLFRWFILQEYIDDFGVQHVKQEPTDEWLAMVNEDFAASEVPHGQRAWAAVDTWSKANAGLPISMSAPRAQRIFTWFRQHTNPAADKVGPIATAAFFHDTSFWPVTIPLAYGSPQLNPLDLIRMPASVKGRFCTQQNDVYIYLKFVADTYDYYYTVEDVMPTLGNNALLADFIGAGREQITQAAALLLGRRPIRKRPKPPDSRSKSS